MCNWKQYLCENCETEPVQEEIITRCAAAAVRGTDCTVNAATSETLEQVLEGKCGPCRYPTPVSA
jgi:hypothetical protein